MSSELFAICRPKLRTYLIYDQPELIADRYFLKNTTHVYHPFGTEVAILTGNTKLSLIYSDDQICRPFRNEGGVTTDFFYGFFILCKAFEDQIHGIEINDYKKYAKFFESANTVAVLPFPHSRDFSINL